jgi:acetyl-CoA carboxylase biotin carboxyl carrier protein
VTDDTAGRAPAGEAEGLVALTEEVLPALIARLRASRLGELEVRTDDWRVRLRLDPRATARATPAGQAGASATAAELNGSVARSTAVGYFTPSPDLAIGHAVQAGDVIGAIDVLGIPQEVVAPRDGLVSSVLVEDGQAVEYGQALAHIDALEPELVEDAEEGA